MTAKHRIALCVTGASGSCYVCSLLEKMEQSGVARKDIALIFSDNGVKVFDCEIGREARRQIAADYAVYANDDFMAPFASGSAPFDAVIVAPCSMGALARIASGVASDLISRTADVALKERRKLVLLVRETPLNLIHIENMLTVTRAGAIVCPASPSFYSRPANFGALLATVTERVLNLCGIDCGSYQWGDS